MKPITILVALFALACGASDMGSGFDGEPDDIGELEQEIVASAAYGSTILGTNTANNYTRCFVAPAGQTCIYPSSSNQETNVIGIDTLILQSEERQLALDILGGWNVRVNNYDTGLGPIYDRDLSLWESDYPNYQTEVIELTGGEVEHNGNCYSMNQYVKPVCRNGSTLTESPARAGSYTQCRTMEMLIDFAHINYCDSYIASEQGITETQARTALRWHAIAHAMALGLGLGRKTGPFVNKTDPQRENVIPLNWPLNTKDYLHPEAKCLLRASMLSWQLGTLFSQTPENACP